MLEDETRTPEGYLSELERIKTAWRDVSPLLKPACERAPRAGSLATRRVLCEHNRQRLAARAGRLEGGT
jgi:hypothetical protein